MSGNQNPISPPDPAASQPAPAATPPDPAVGQPAAAVPRAPPAPEATVNPLEARVTELEGQIADLTDRLLRAHAEMDNVRKRMEREKLDIAKYAISKFANDVVGTTDNFQRAIQAVPPGAAEQDPALKSLIEGVSMTERAFLQVLERHGVERIEPKGEIFNPERHQAVMEQHNADVAAGTVLNVLQAGFVIEDRVLRPAMVVVARGGFKPVKASEQATKTSDGPSPANDDVPPASDAAGPGSTSRSS